MTALMGLAITGRWLASAAVLNGKRDAAGEDGVAMPKAKLATMVGGHVVHFDASVGFASKGRELLNERLGDGHN